MGNWAQDFTQRFQPRVTLPRGEETDAKTIPEKLWKLAKAHEKSSDLWWKREMVKLAYEAENEDKRESYRIPLEFLIGFITATAVFLTYLAR